MSKGKGKGFSKGKGKNKGLKGKGKGGETTDVSFVDPKIIGQTIAPEHTRKEPFGRLRKEQSGTMRAKSGSERLKSTERIKIGLSTKAHCSMTVHGLRTIGLLIGGLMIAMIGLRIGHGMMILSWHWPAESQASLPPPSQTIATQATAAKAASIAPQAPVPHTAAAVIASPPGLAPLSPSDQIANDSLIASSSSSTNPRGSSGARTARPGIASKLFVGALMLIGTLSSKVPIIPDFTDIPQLSAPHASEAPLLENIVSRCKSVIHCQSQLNIGSMLHHQIDWHPFHADSGEAEQTWILFDSGASANCCPPWFASDYPLLPVGSDCPILRSISGKTLDILGKRIVELDCGGHSLCVHFYVCQSIPFPLVSVARFLLQDFWTIMSRSFMALMTPTQKIVPIIRQGTLVYMTPSVVPYCESDCNMTEAQVNALMSDVDLHDCDIELRGITDVADDAFDHIAQIHSLIAAAKDKSKTKPKTLDKPKKRADYKNSDYWIVSEDKSLLIRHHVKQRQSLFGFRYLRGELPVDEKRLTGHRETERFFIDGSSDVIVDEDFRNTDDDKVEPGTRLNRTPWRGRTSFELTPLKGQALVSAKKAAEKFQEAPTEALQKNRFRLSQAKSQAPKHRRKPRLHLHCLISRHLLIKPRPPNPLLRISASPAEEPRWRLNKQRNPQRSLIDNTLLLLRIMRRTS